MVAISTIPTISAIPTGSLKPDSPSRIVPDRPLTSFPARTENVTAGSVGASAAPIAPTPSTKGRADVGRDCDQRGGRRTCRGRRGRQSAPRHAGSVQAHLRAALEQDHDQGERRDPLDVVEGRIPASRSKRSEAAAARTRSGPPSESRGGRRSHGRRAPARGARGDEDQLTEARGGRPRGDLARRLGAAERRRAGARLTLSLRPSHPEPTRRTDTAGTHAPCASHCGRARRSPYPAGWAAVDPCRLALGRGRARHRRAQGEGDRDRAARARRGGDRRPLAARPVEPARQRRSARKHGVDARQGHQLLRPRRPLQITVRGEGFSISARGQGTRDARRPPRPAGATGTFAVGDAAASPIPGAPRTRPVRVACR